MEINLFTLYISEGYSKMIEKVKRGRIDLENRRVQAAKDRIEASTDFVTASLETVNNLGNTTFHLSVLSDLLSSVPTLRLAEPRGGQDSGECQQHPEHCGLWSE